MVIEVTACHCVTNEPERFGMTKTLLLCFALMIVSGCTTPALRRHTVNQAMSVTDMRYQEIMQGLAVVAHNGGVLPSIAVNTGGTATVANTVGIESATTWDTAVTGFSKQLLNLGGKHAPTEAWTVAPVAAEPNLEALRAAFCWTVYGAPEFGSEAMQVLRAPQHDDETGYHFGVADSLQSLPQNWLKWGHRCDVPKCVCYQAQCGDTFVWVTRDGMAGLSEFTLIVMDIATTDPTSLAYQPLVASVDVLDTTNHTTGSPNDKVKYWDSAVTVTETRGVKQDDKDQTIYVQKSRISSLMLPTILPGDAGPPTQGEVNRTTLPTSNIRSPAG
jgi:hypothetical protein